MPATARPSEAPLASFVWLPGHGCDRDALARLCAALPQPELPMGEAWFMGTSRKMFDWLYDDPDTLTPWHVEKALEEIVTGTHAFGPREEWEAWFHYLLPRVLPRCNDLAPFGGSGVVDALVTAFITQHPAGFAREPYEGFGADALATLGRAIMTPEGWPNGQLDVEATLGNLYGPSPDILWWHDVSTKLSSSLFFCLKYLPCDEIQPWLASVLAIAAPQWRAHVIAWLVGAHPLLTGPAQPSILPMGGYPNIAWFRSEVLDGRYTGDFSGRAVPIEFIPAQNCRAAMSTIADHVEGAAFLDWLAVISADPVLEAALDDLPFEVHRLYRGR